MSQERAKREPRNKKRTRRFDRKDFGDFNQKLVVPNEVKEWAKSNNKTLRFVNDSKARISQLLARDWDFVEYQGGEIGEGQTLQDMGNGYSTVVGTQENGEPLRAYLMCKDKDWYQEDTELKQAEVDKVDEDIRAGAVGKVENVYQPKDGSGRTLTKYKP